MICQKTVLPVEDVDNIAYRKEPIVLLDDSDQILGWEWLLHHDLPKNVSDWVLALSALYKYLDKPVVGGAFYSINGSSAQLGNSVLRHLFFDIAERCQDLGIPLVLEWTEFSPAHPESIHVLEALRRLYGVQIAIDDAGSSGIDALWRMSRVRPDWIKIDGRWLHRAIQEDWAAEILHQSICSARNLGIKTVIEWIETPRHLSFARELGADCGQGFYWRGKIGAG